MSHPLAPELEGLKLFVKGKLPVAGIRLLAARLAEPGILDGVMVAIGKQAATLALALRKLPRGRQPEEDRLADMLLERLGDVGSADGGPDDTEGSAPGSRSKSSAKLPTFTAFQIKKVLGQGGMGTVYLADDPRLGRQVAIKTLKREFAEKPGAVARFLREARTAAQVEHDHICPIYQIGEENGIAFIAMPFLKGEPLDDRLKREKRLPIPLAIRIGREIALGLGAAHDTGLIHRDIKPANIWLESGRGQFPRVRILDFGLARDQGSDVEMTAAGTVVGTPSYMAPEQARGKKVDGRADLWSLGVILYMMTTGNKPFTGEDTMAILTSLALDTPPAPQAVNSEVPPELSALIMRLLAKNPDARPPTGHVVADELAGIPIDPTLPVVGAVAPPPAEVWGSFGESTEEVSGPRSASATKQFNTAGPAGKPRSLVLPLVLAAGGAFALIAVVVIFLLASGGKDGALTVESDSDTDARFKNGKLELYADGKLKYTLEPGEKSKPVAAGNYQVRMVGGDGVKLETDSVTMKSGGKAVVRLTSDRPAVAARKDPPKTSPVDPAPPKTPVIPPKPPGTTNPPKPNPEAGDRGAAEYVLSVGGRLRTNYYMLPEVSAAGALPDGQFSLVVCDLSGSGVTDAGLAGLANCRILHVLNLGNTKVTDAGLANFRGPREMYSLSLANTSVTDAGLENFRDARKLLDLDLSGTATTDAGLASFGNCKNMTGLRLVGSRIGIGSLPALQTLDKLTLLDVRKTDLKPAAISQLVEKLPYCRIEHDGGIAEPAVPPDPDRRAAEHTLAIGGRVRIDGESRVYVFAPTLPRKPFNLTSCEFDNVGYRLSDSALAHFRHCKGLARLHAAYTSVTDAGLAHLSGCSGLRAITLNNTTITDAGLAHLKDCKNLERLEIKTTPVTDAGLAHLKDCKRLAVMFVGNTRVADGSLPVLKGFPSLVHLDARGSKLSPEAAIQLADLFPDLRIECDRRPPVEPTANEPDRRTALFTLAMGGSIRADDEPRWIRSAAGLPPVPFRLTGLDLSSMVPDNFDALTRYFRGCRRLTVIDLASSNFADAWLHTFRDNGFVRLRDLDLQGTILGDGCLQTLEGFAELATLNVRRSRLKPESIRRLAAKLPNCKIEHDGDIIPQAESERDRRAAVSVVLAGGTVRINVDDRRFNTVGELPQAPFWLTHVDLGDNKQAKDADLAPLTDCKSLRVVRLANTPTTDEGTAFVKSSKDLELLDLSGTKVSDKGLASLKGYDRLRHLDLSATSASDACLPTLETLTGLETLHVTKSKLTPAAVKKLAAKLPDCRITHDGGVTGPK